MLVFIDDSGDPGFKFDKGSTRFFVISLVIFDDPLQAEKVAVAIKDLRRSLKFPDEMEFKFHKSKRMVRERFLRTINPFQFRIRNLVIDKTKIKSDKLKYDKNSFYSYAIKTVLRYSYSIVNARIKIDGSGDRVFRRSFLGYLRQQLNSKQRKVVENCKLVDSNENVLIQMADMVSGSVRRSYDHDKSDSVVYKNIVKKHIEDEWEFE